MTVKELREALAKYPDDAPVFLYNEVDEGDGLLDEISIETPIEEWNGDCEPVAFYSPHYCQADSEAEQYWNSYGKNAPIVFLIATNTFHDFEEERKRKENV